MHGQTGQATVEWVALLLLAVLILGAAAVHSSAKDDRDLGELVAKRIASAPRAVGVEAGAGAPAPGADGAAPSAGTFGPTTDPRAPMPVAPPPMPGAPAPMPAAPPLAAPPPAAPPAPGRAADAIRRGVGRVAERAWIVCLGYRRLRHELEHPRAPNEALPLGDVLDIANTCLNPYDFLFGD